MSHPVLYQSRRNLRNTHFSKKCSYVERGADRVQSLGADEVDEEEDGGGEQRRRRRRHESREGRAQVGRVLGAVPQQQELRDQTQNLF